MQPIKPWQELTFTDDYMFKKTLEARDISKGVLNESLSWDIERVTYFEEEKPLKPHYDGKGVRLDAYLHDERERIYDVEMQVRKMREKGLSQKEIDDGIKILAKRARCYLDEIDMDRMQRGSRYSELRPTFVIFYCPFPLFDGKQSVYRFPRICIDNPELVLPDESELIFITSKGNRTGLSKSMCALLDYMNGKVSDDPLVQRIEERIHTVKKQEQEERDYMMFEMRRREELAEASAEAEARGEGNIVRRMILDHAPMNFIQKYSGWTSDQIMDFAKKNHLVLP